MQNRAVAGSIKAIDRNVSLAHIHLCNDSLITLLALSLHTLVEISVIPKQSRFHLQSEHNCKHLLHL